MSANDTAVFETNLTGLELLSRGKVRDIYAIDDQFMLIVATDRLSAFDVVLSDPIPGKGEVLTQLTNFWLERLRDVTSNHLADLPLDRVVTNRTERERIARQATVVRRLRPLPIEAIVRGYIIGSGWKDYQRTGCVSGIELPGELQQADQLPQPIFTPSTKADIGDHDENISFSAMANLIGEALANKVRDVSLDIYARAAGYAAERGIIIADTKLEFGLDQHQQLVLIDEVLTPDSSRFWPASEYAPGTSPPSYDKQFVRDYLETLGWDKRAPAPTLPEEIIAKTSQKYREAWQRLAG